jgi:hypothetical protein
MLIETLHHNWVDRRYIVSFYPDENCLKCKMINGDTHEIFRYKDLNWSIVGEIVRIIEMRGLTDRTISSNDILNSVVRYL